MEAWAIGETPAGMRRHKAFLPIMRVAMEMTPVAGLSPMSLILTGVHAADAVLATLAYCVAADWLPLLEPLDVRLAR